MNSLREFLRIRILQRSRLPEIRIGCQKLSTLGAAETKNIQTICSLDPLIVVAVVNFTLSPAGHRRISILAANKFVILCSVSSCFQ